MITMIYTGLMAGCSAFILFGVGLIVWHNRQNSGPRETPAPDLAPEAEADPRIAVRTRVWGGNISEEH